MDMKRILSYAKTQQASMVNDLETLVNYESSSHDKARLDLLAAILAKRFSAIGGDTEILSAPRHGNHVRIFFRSAQPDTECKPALILGHFDTVWPAGTLAKRPFRVVEGLAFGPGAFDMKGGIVVIEYALRAINALNLCLPRPIVIMLNSDEEIGSPHSRKYIEEHARESEYVLVMEPAMPGGELKTARKGVGAFRLAVEGRAAHAGSEPESGVNAIVELAHQILHLQTFADPELGTTINVGTVSGGTRSNVVPAHAQARIDVRTWTLAEARRIEKSLGNLKPVNSDVKLKVSGGFGRPPMERLPGAVKLFEKAVEVGKQMDMALVEGKTGGASDGNFCAALGISVLDGLGVEGSGAHADHEQVNISSLPERAALLAGLLCMAS